MRHYLDYAATSAVRPPEVVAAVTAFLTDNGCTPGRGGHSCAMEAGRVAFRCRRALARVLGAKGDPGRIAFMQNATHAINTALWGLLGEGDVVVVSQYDHNAVLRPAHHLHRMRGIEVRMLSGDPSGSVDMEEAARLLDGATVLVLNAASNVLGTALPVAELAGLARQAGALVVADGAQSAGHLLLDLPAAGVDVIAFTGHKGLLGPQGTGGLWVREGVQVDPLICGGTGGDSRRREMPPTMPDHLEAGTGNAPGIAGLLAGCEFVLGRGVDTIHAHEMGLKASLRAGLEAIPGLRVLSPPGPDGVAVVTVAPERLDPATLADRLDRDHGVLTRAGLHCAPEVHRILGTEESGAVRFSLGWASTEGDVEAAVSGVDAILSPTRVAVAGDA
ncbi:MAG: aminotransferase class V-fold PLP-dependent enzyme [Gemmatimonadetes bacterium]|nr:aminotransferase class V-fold PLP-dependent enzyme [Gemmatimonadota bacterium]NNM31980.1 aminotransferase class V-fold PLP-dependent enzyme [Gemmatimonadota bacterium]